MTTTTKPVLNYCSICGRGELARLIAAAGEVEIEDKACPPVFGDDGGWRPGYKAIGEDLGFPGTMPVLSHGDFNVFQAHAVENYLASKDLTPQQRAKDLMFALIMGDINVPTENVLFKKITPEELAPIMDKYYGIVESQLPEAGFVNGLDFPVEYPKMERVAADAIAYPPVAKFLEASEYKTLKADPFKIMPEEYHA
jgi:hypothetical protein